MDDVTYNAVKAVILEYEEARQAARDESTNRMEIDEKMQLAKINLETSLTNIGVTADEYRLEEAKRHSTPDEELAGIAYTKNVSEYYGDVNEAAKTLTSPGGDIEFRDIIGLSMWDQIYMRRSLLADRAADKIPDTAVLCDKVGLDKPFIHCFTETHAAELAVKLGLDHHVIPSSKARFGARHAYIIQNDIGLATFTKGRFATREEAESVTYAFQLQLLRLLGIDAFLFRNDFIIKGRKVGCGNAKDREGVWIGHVNTTLLFDYEIGKQFFGDDAYKIITANEILGYTPSLPQIKAAILELLPKFYACTVKEVANG